MKGKELRISQILGNEETCLADLSGVAFSKIKNLENMRESFDGIIFNLNQLKKFSSLLNFKNSAAPLLKIYHKLDSFIKKIRFSKTLTPLEVLKSGANALVSSFYFGYGEKREAENVKIITDIMRESNRIEIPVFVNVYCDGPKIDEKNFSSVIKLSITMLTEWGADGILIPYVEENILEELRPFSPPPVFRMEKEEDKIKVFKRWK